MNLFTSINFFVLKIVHLDFLINIFCRRLGSSSSNISIEELSLANAAAKFHLQILNLLKLPNLFVHTESRQSNIPFWIFFRTKLEILYSKMCILTVAN